MAHLSAQRIERYQQGKLAPAELLTVDDHLAGCAACRDQMGGADQLRKAFVALGPDLETAAANEPAHLAPHQMAAYVDGQLGEVDRSIADEHLDHCVECQSELLDLNRLKPELALYPGVEQAPKAAPVRGNRLVALGPSSARWVPLIAAALLVLLFVWLGLLPMRKQVTMLNEQLGELQKRNDALEEKIRSLAALSEKETQDDIPTPAEPILIALNDGGRVVTLDKQGRLAGLKSQSDPYEQLVKAALTEQRVRVTPLLSDLVGKPGVIMGTTPEPGDFSLSSPVGTVIESDRPMFRWSRLTGAVRYVVTVYHTTSRAVIVSPSLTEPEWMPPNPLERGGIYAWEVTATLDGKELTVPKPPAPQARFSVLPQPKVDELNRAKRMYPGSHLMLGILCAQAGLLDEAEREFKALVAANPDSLTAQKLLRSVRARKDQ